MSEEKRLEAEAASLRRIAFAGVALSTVATLVCVLAVPMLYNYMQHMQSVMQNEVDFCKSRSGNVWKEVTRTQVPLPLLLYSRFRCSPRRRRPRSVRSVRLEAAAVAAESRPLVLPVLPVLMDPMETMEPLVFLELLEPTPREALTPLSWLPSATAPATLLLDPPESPDPRDHPETPVPPVPLDLLETPEPLESPDLLAPLDPTESPDLLDLPEPMEKSPRCPAPRDLPDLLDPLERLDPLEALESLESLALLVLPERLESLDQLDPMDSPVPTAQPESLELQELAAAASTARTLALLPDIKTDVLLLVCTSPHSHKGPRGLNKECSVLLRLS